MQPPGAPAPPSPAQTPVVLLSIAAVLVGVWIVAGTALLQGVGWFVAELLFSLGEPVPPWAWPVVAWINAGLVAAPAGLVWALARHVAGGGPHLAGARAAGRAWTIAGLAAGFLGSVRAVPVPHNEFLLLLTALVAAGSALVVRRLQAPTPADPGPRRSVAGFGLAGGLLVMLPWLWVGALGGLAETVLAVIAAAAVGWLAATILDSAFFEAFRKSRPWQVLVGGLAAGVALAPLGAAIGGTGVNLAEMLVLPALGLTAAALAAAAAPTRLPRAPIVALVGVAAAGPLVFVDPEETSIVLGTSDVGWWALIGAVLSVVVALAAGTGYGLVLSPRRWRQRWIPAAAAVLVALAGIGVYGQAGRPGLYGERLLVILADQPDLAGLENIADRPARLRATYERLVSHANRTQAPLRASLARWGLEFTPYYLVNAVLVDGGPLVRRWLARRTDVDRVLLDQRARPLPVAPPTEEGTSPAPDGSPQWNIQLVRADRAWRELGATGRGIVIGTSDSGVDGTHPALRNGFRGGDDSWFDPWNGTATPTDHGGHGTHTLGSALGRGGIGVAPEAQWVGCVNLDRNLGSPSLYLDCLQFMLAPFPHGGDPWRDGRPDRAPHILTNSWGCPEIEGCDPDSLRSATAALRAAGIFFATAAGNAGPFCGSVDDPPAPYGDAFTVGAVDRNRQVASFSSRGPTSAGLIKPDVVAPGVGVLSAMPGGTYGSLDGTSMATPHVAGVVALMWSANPRLVGDVSTTERILRQAVVPATPSYLSGDPADSCGTITNITGAGLVDAYAAVQAADKVS